MADTPVVNTSTVYIGSHMEAEVGYGDAADPYNPSSIRKGETIKRSTNAKAILGKPVDASVRDWQTRPVSAKQAVPTTPTMKNQNSAAKIPKGLNRAVTQPAPRGRR